MELSNLTGPLARYLGTSIEKMTRILTRLFTNYSEMFAIFVFITRDLPHMNITKRTQALNSRNDRF